MVNKQTYQERRREILHEILRVDDGTREVLLGELRSLREIYECDCHKDYKDLSYECKQDRRKGR